MQLPYMGGVNNVQALYMVGTPNNGSPMTYSITDLGLVPDRPVLEDMVLRMILNKTALDIIGKTYMDISSKERIAFVKNNVKSMLQLRYNGNNYVKSGGKYKKVAANSFLSQLNKASYSVCYKPVGAPASKKGVYAAIFYSTSNAKTAAGFNESTITKNGKKEMKAVPYYAAGDGTVTVDSAVCGNLFGKNWSYFSGSYGDHSGLCKNGSIVSKLYELLKVK